MSKLDMNKLMQQAQQMQSQMQQLQEEVANEVVEASAGGGMVTVKATGGGEIKGSCSIRRRSTRTIRRCSPTSSSPPSTRHSGAPTR